MSLTQKSSKKGCFAKVSISKKELYFIFLFLMCYFGPGINIGSTHVRILELFFLAMFFINFRYIVKKKRTRNFGLFFLLFSGSMIISNLYGYAFLNIHPAYNDFMLLFKVVIYVSCYSIGYKFILDDKLQKSWMIATFIVLFIILCIAILEIKKSPIIGYILGHFYLSNEFYEDLVSRSRYMRPMATFGNTNSFTIVLLPLLATSLNYYFFKNKKRILILNLLIVITLIVLTMSRSGLICMLAIILISLFFIRFQKKIFFLLCTASLIVAFFVTFQSSLFFNTLVYRMTTNVWLVQNPERKSGIQVRLDRWEAGYLKYKSSPILGWGSNKSAMSKGRDGFIPVNIGTQSVPNFPDLATFSKPHNQYIEVMMKMGIPGLILYLGFFIILIEPSFQFKRRQKEKWLHISLLTLVFALAINAFMVGFIFSNTIMLPILFIIGSLHRTIDQYPSHFILGYSPKYHPIVK